MPRLLLRQVSCAPVAACLLGLWVGVPAWASDTLVMGVSNATGGMTSRLYSWAEVESTPSLLAYPEPRDNARFLTVPYGEKRLAMAFVGAGTAWTVSADLDGDGVVRADEQVLVQQGVEGVLVGRSPPGPATPDGRFPVVPFRVTVDVKDGVVVAHIVHETLRFGSLPNGAAVALTTFGGRADIVGATVVVDLDQDGDVDLDNRLAEFAVATDLVPMGDGYGRLQPSADGTTMEWTAAAGTPAGLRFGSRAPDFSLKASDGKLHTLADYRGRVLLLDFWATWCAPCVALHPEVEALAQRYGLAVLGVSANDTQVEVDRWLVKHPSSFPTAAIGPAGSVNQAYGVDAWPSHALIDADGRLVVLGAFSAVERALHAGIVAAP